MASIVKQRRSFTAGFDPNISIPATAADLGTIVINGLTVESQMWIATADDAIGTNPIWTPVGGGGTGINAAAQIADNTAGVGPVEADANAQDFTGGAMLSDPSQVNGDNIIIAAGYNWYFAFVNDPGVTYLWVGPVDVEIGTDLVVSPSHYVAQANDFLPLSSVTGVIEQNPATNATNVINPLGNFRPLQIHGSNYLAGPALELVTLGVNDLLVLGAGTTFNDNGFMRSGQGSISTGPAVQIEGFGGNPNPVLNVMNRVGDPLMQVLANDNFLGDGVQRSRVNFGAATSEGVIDNAIVDGGVI